MVFGLIEIGIQNLLLFLFKNSFVEIFFLLVHVVVLQTEE